MKKGLRGKLFLLLGVLVVCLLLAASAGLLARKAWRSRQMLIPLLSGIISPHATEENPQPTQITPAQIAHPPLVISTRETSEESKSPRYSIEASWPVLEWGGDPRVDAFNQAAEGIIQDEIRGFKEGIAQLPNEPGLDEFGSSLKISFTTTNANNGILSVLFRVAFYSAGAAHPGSYSHAINYDLREGKALALDDLFNPDRNYLDPISAACLDDLKARGVLGWEDGALPKAENYQVWNVTPEGLRITFDEYQVAPYAAGPQAVTIPYEKLKDIIRLEGPLAVFIHPGK